MQKEGSLGFTTRLVRLLIILAILFTLLLLWAYPALKPEIQRACFETNLKKRVTPAELQTWALNILQTHDTNKTSDYGEVTNLHPAFAGLFVHPPTAVWYSASPLDDIAFVRVYYGGGGIGHWGVEIASTNRPKPQSYGSRRYTAWAPGVCFFTGQ